MTQADEARALEVLAQELEQTGASRSADEVRGRVPFTLVPIEAVLPAMLAFRAEALPDGYVAVPRVPTDAMLDAAAETPGIKAVSAAMSLHQVRGYSFAEGSFDDGSPLAQAWAAMLREALSAAPVDGDGWLPEADAPEDEDLLIWRSPKGAAPESYGFRTIGRKVEGLWFDERGEEIDAPTKYRPLPAPPADTEPKP